MYRRIMVMALGVACGGGGGGETRDGSPGPHDGTIVTPDPCDVAPACPVAPALVRGGGLRTIDRCAFPLTPDDVGETDFRAAIAALPPQLSRVGMQDIAGDLNRVAVRVTSAQLPGDPPGFQRAYAWQAGDESVAYWIPQGISGSFDANPDGLVAGRKLVLVSWYYSREADSGSLVEKGVRIAIADVTDPADVRYRFALLVEPFLDAGRASFRSVPVHAGGLAWIGDRLYVPITGSGFRVFDLSQILRIDGLEDRIGYDATTDRYHAHSYAYAIPEIARYTSTGACSPRFSFVALDRSSSPASLISGEYDAASIAGRLYRWPLAADGMLARTDRGRVIADGAWFESESHVQGALARDATFWLTSSRPAGTGGELVRTALDTPSVTLGWSDSPEDLALDPQAMTVWSVTEGLDARYLFEVALGSID
ncbi:MAG: hypothetical protein WKG01_04915 [Kofleriaceae bacterium]